mmetsp:Transcript_5901/g.12478  ORF Transcript_5901/g.12478 Transcript_5901/m.12478 type:complete len:154 (-) Transcript_5901:140-601(-)
MSAASVSLPSINWAFWDQIPSHQLQQSNASIPSSFVRHVGNAKPSTQNIYASSVSNSRSPIEPSSSKTSPIKKKSKRGRKPCSNPSPQALRQRAYRLRKQMKKIQNEANGQPEETNINDTSSPQEINENISSLSAHEHFIAEILINLKQEIMH